MWCTQDLTMMMKEIHNTVYPLYTVYWLVQWFLENYSFKLATVSGVPDIMYLFWGLDTNLHFPKMFQHHLVFSYCLTFFCTSLPITEINYYLI